MANYIETSKLTVRVLRPPGGGSSNILNPEPEEHANRKVKNYNRSDIFNQCADDKPATVVVKDYNKSDVLNQSGAGGDAQKPSTAQRKEEGDSDEEAEEASKTAPPPVEAPVRVKGPQHVTGYNIINNIANAGHENDEFDSPIRGRKRFTDTKRGEEGINPITGMVIGAPQTTERPSTKVHHPPGGKSTALW
ncbi:uncharacterized protein LOC106168311 isoform X1 [Lingula anatina]|uniref:Microtubule-associated protein Jupiter n=1 Tax=Lingula anatina TaxID=7574 RepID=A0A1S3IXM7_LINAN|nr:uncharacterized protein LOC106168311 isoform X1 [Lingula anatina]|eukprot:XP_013402783.1 uncharacterized protein LOC106168311 isoform X1 [Lingula anatina]